MIEGFPEQWALTRAEDEYSSPDSEGEGQGRPRKQPGCPQSCQVHSTLGQWQAHSVSPGEFSQLERESCFHGHLPSHTWSVGWMQDFSPDGFDEVGAGHMDLKNLSTCFRCELLVEKQGMGLGASGRQRDAMEI